MFRLPLVALLGAALFSVSAGAQTAGPVSHLPESLSRSSHPFGGTLAGTPLDSTAPERSGTAASALVGCAAGATVSQTATGSVYNITTVNTGVGQSFTAPCDGFLTSIAFAQNRNATNVSTTTSMTLYTIQGEGLAGALLDAVSYNLTNGATTGSTAYTLPLYEPVPVVQGAAYTFFLEYDGGGVLRPLVSTANPYAGGQVYNTAATPAQDLYFVATFQPATVATTPVVYNGPGYRLLSVPVTGVSVRDLAALNLVQGVPGDGTTTDAPANYPRQYPTAADNLYTAYNGSGTYTPAAFTYDLLSPGRGFFWQWYDQAYPTLPNATFQGGGTSYSRELTDFTLSQAGPALTANVARAFTLNADGNYMLGNPFPLPFAVSGLSKTAGDGTLTTSVQAWDPSASTYKILFASNPANAGASDYVAVWDGFFAEVTGATTAPTFTYAIASTSTTATPPFYGRSAASATPYLQFRLNGTTASGAAVADIAAYVRFLPDALAGQDADDAGKLTPPPGVAYALLAPVGERDGVPVRLAVDALPSDLTEAVTVPVAFTASEAGAFALAWDGAAGLPDAWTATLHDTRTGALVDLRTAETYAFTAEAGAWAERFAVVVAPRGAVATEPGAPAAFALAAPSPNPAAASATVTFDVPTASDVRVAVYDLLGRRVAVLAEGEVAVGRHTARIDAGALAPGVYVVRMEAGTFSAARRVTVIR